MAEPKPVVCVECRERQMFAVEAGEDAGPVLYACNACGAQVSPEDYAARTTPPPVPVAPGGPETRGLPMVTPAPALWTPGQP